MPPLFHVPCLCRTIGVSPVDFRLRSLHRKVPFPATDFRTWQPEHQSRANSRSVPDPFWIQSEHFELFIPFRRRVSEPLDTNPTRQLTLDRGLHESRCKECERHGHVDLTHAACLTRAAGTGLAVLDPKMFLRGFDDNGFDVGCGNTGNRTDRCRLGLTL